MLKQTNFKVDLQYSHNYEAFWKRVYKTFFPTHVALYKGETLEAQFKGIDRVVVFKNGNTLGIDEKMQRNIWSCFALEYLSNDVISTPGWMEKDLSIDYIAYAFKQDIVYLLNWKELKQVWETNKKEWIGKHKVIRAQNYGYCTYSIAVPIEEIIDKLSYYHYKKETE